MSRLPSDQHSKQKQPPTPQLLHSAANLLFSNCNAGGNPTKQRMASQLINAWKQGGGTGSIDAVQMPLPPVAGSTKELLAMLRTDPCFRVVQGPAGGSASGYSVSLNAATLISKAKAATKTGFLTEELPPPTGYVAGKHPIRPGQPNCKQLVQFGECSFNKRCVWNHAGKPSDDQQKPKQPTSNNNSSSSTPAAPLVPAPPPSKPAWGGAGIAAAAARPAPQQQPLAQGATTTSSSSSSNGDSGGAGSSAPAAPSTSSNGIIQDTSDSSSRVAAVLASGTPHDQSAQLPQQQAAPSKLPPGFAAVNYKGRPCQLMMLRGFCPMGDKCAYDHPPRAGAGGQPGSVPAAATQQAVIPTVSTDGHAAAQADSPLSADAHPPTPEALYKPAAQHAAAQHAAAQHAAAQHAAAQHAAAAHPATATSTAAAGATACAGGSAPQAAHHSWRSGLAGPQQHQQQAHGADVQQQDSAAAAGTTAAAAGSAEAAAAAPSASSSVCSGRADKLLGWTEGDLPQHRGEPNCPFYMGTGTCKFKGACMFHHPPAAEHPECLLRGEWPRKYSANKEPSYGRLVQHLYRVYDYDSCVEAQLKVWLAKFVLSKNNPESHMFSSSAKRAAYPARGKGFHWQPLGPYTCSMGEAGQLLHGLWRTQPDEAASQPMPYTKQLRELLAGDPYWDCVPDPNCSSHFWVKLDVEKIKGLLNF